MLITNAPPEGESALSTRDTLVEYKSQNGIERNFGFLKDPLIVNDTFLKKAERIEALGMILLTALLVWNLMERAMRSYINEQSRTLDGWDKKQTTRPTSFMMAIKFQHVKIVKVALERYLADELTPIQKNYLKALALTEDSFSTPTKYRERACFIRRLTILLTASPLNCVTMIRW